MLIVMEKSTDEEHLSQQLQTISKHFEIPVIFLTGYNGFFNVTDKDNKVYFTKSISDKGGFIQITTPPRAYEVESLNNEIKRININEGHFTEVDNPFIIKLNFSTLGSIVERSTQGPVITFVPDDSTRDLIGFKKTTIYEENNTPPNPVDILSFDNFFFECDIAHGMIFKGKRSGIFHNFTMTVVLSYKYFESFTGRITWCMMETKDNISSICFK